jgi:hypothetical protein
MSHVFSLFDGSDGKVSRSVVLFMLQLLLRSIDGDEGTGWDEDSNDNEGEGDGERDGRDGGESDESEQSGDNDESTDGAENSDENSEGSDASGGEDDDDSGGEFDYLQHLFIYCCGFDQQSSHEQPVGHSHGAILAHKQRPTFLLASTFRWYERICAVPLDKAAAAPRGHDVRREHAVLPSTQLERGWVMRRAWRGAMHTV